MRVALWPVAAGWLLLALGTARADEPVGTFENLGSFVGPGGRMSELVGHDPDELVERDRLPSGSSCPKTRRGEVSQRVLDRALSDSRQHAQPGQHADPAPMTARLA